MVKNCIGVVCGPSVIKILISFMFKIRVYKRRTKPETITRNIFLVEIKFSAIGKCFRVLFSSVFLLHVLFLFPVFLRTSLANIAASGRPYTASQRTMPGHARGSNGATSRAYILKIFTNQYTHAESILLWPHASLANSSVRLHSAICEISVIYVNSLP